jgi:hypothetical protein
MLAADAVQADPGGRAHGGGRAGGGGHAYRGGGRTYGGGGYAYRGGGGTYGGGGYAYRGGGRTYGGGGDAYRGSGRTYGGGGYAYRGGGRTYGGGGYAYRGGDRYYGGSGSYRVVRRYAGPYYRYYRPRTYVSFGFGLGAPYYHYPPAYGYYVEPYPVEVGSPVDVTNEPPAGCYYYDRFCDRRFSDLDDYTDHLESQNHLKTIEIVQDDSGDALRTLELVDGYWRVRD